MAQDPRALLQKAEQAASKAGGGFSLFGGRQEKWEHAADLYNQAANAFRLQKANREAGQAFEKKADIEQTKLNEPDEAANSLQEAFKAYRKTDPEDAARVIEAAISIWTSQGKFRRAATQKQNVAEVYEVEIDDKKRAIEAYELAATWFEGDNAEALANKLWLKVAEIAALEGDYYKAIKYFDNVASTSVSNNLMKWSVKEYFLKAGLCHLATGDLVGTEKAMEKYREMDMTFSSTREHQLVVDLMETVRAGDQEAFADKLFQYDQMSKLDKWKTTILLKIKAGIEEKEEDFS